MKIKSLVIAFGFMAVNASADINGDLNRFFNEMNYSGVNSTKGSVWKGQAAGYLTGGGLYARTANRNIQLASISLPSINAGCGGIDMYLGSFSFINGEQITRFIKSLMSNGLGYAFDLALETLTPALKSVKDHLQTLMQAVNDTNFSSCQAAQALVGSIGVSLGASKDYVCNSFGNSSNGFSDWVQSRMECGVGGKATAMNESAQQDEKWKDMSLTDMNLSWYILNEKSKNTMAEDRQLKELMMTLMGSIIFDNDSQVKTLLPLLDNPDVIKALLNGGTAQIYVCDEDKKCLNPQFKNITIQEKNGLKQKVDNLLTSIIDKVEKDSDSLTEKEKNFIESTSIPVLKYLIDPMSVQLSKLLINDLTNFIAYDLLYQYITEQMKIYNIAAVNTNVPSDVAEKLMALHARARQQLENIRATLTFQESALLKLEQQMHYIRTQASTNLMSSYLSNYDF